MHHKIWFLLLSCLFFHFGKQLCPEEITTNGIHVTWPQSLPGRNIRSTPACYNNASEVTRTCLDDTWIPAANKLIPCLQNGLFSNIAACPPGFYSISKNLKEYCYQISAPSSWEYPCLKGGGATVITDFADDDVLSLLDSLRANNISQYYWLPAKRTRILTPMTWYVSGPKWGHPVESNNLLSVQASIFKNCLLLDVKSRKISAETCSTRFPSICFYVNNLYYPGKCPQNYHAIRYMPDFGICFGIEYSKKKLQFDDFIRGKCNAPMGNNKYYEITKFIFRKIAETDQLSDKSWCWFDKMSCNNTDTLANSTFEKNIVFENPLFSNTDTQYIAINNIGTLSLFDSTPSKGLSCMACKTEIIYEITELVFEYEITLNMILLTIYYPSGLWKYNIDDRGIQCFSDATGFVKVIDVQDLPIFSNGNSVNSTDDDFVEKIVYRVNLVTNRSAQYWCEGHTKNFTLIATDRIVVNPKGTDVHVFSLVLKVHILKDILQNNLDVALEEVCSNIQKIFKADTVLWMDVLDYTLDHLMVLLHVHVSARKFDVDEDDDVVTLYETLKLIAQTELEQHNYIFVNISSSVYCLPTTTADNSYNLDWELTLVGHITAPTQFCLQENGLPVRRLCDGSYLFGGFWGEVKGSCDINYLPSVKTKFLYMFVKGQVPKKNTTRFLIDGLEFALSNKDIIIPADIYYLSMSLQHVLYLTQANESAIDLGDIANIARAMNKIMVLNIDYLRLAQTLNSTNVIVDTINKIIEIIALKNRTLLAKRRKLKGKYFTSALEQAVEQQFIVQISYPKINNISGIAVSKISHSDKFTDMEITPLYRNTSLQDVLSIKNLEIATWLPDTVINNLKRSNDNQSKDDEINEEDVCVILNIFHSNSVFQDLNTKHYKLNSRIVGISLPGFVSNFMSPIPLIYRGLNTSSKEKDCGYWEFNTNKESKVPGYWSSRGCYVKKSIKNLTLCECYHLTHFGQLLNIRKLTNPDDYEKNHKHFKSLNIISLVGSFLSLIGIMGIWVTASIFHKWRKKAGTKLLLHLSVSIALPLIFMIIFNLGNSVFTDTKEKPRPDEVDVVCIIFGAFLHYSVLASFVWMLITAILQFARYVRVLGVRRPSRFIIKFTFIGWGVPLLPVVVVLSVNRNNYVPDVLGEKDHYYSICYPNGIFFILGIVVPICLILFVNIILYILVIWAISRGPDGKLRATDIDLLGAQFRLSIFLFFLLGLTWIFGVFSFSNNYIWSYLFCLTSTLQGFVLFIYFIIFDPDTRNLWWTLMKPQLRSSKPRESITSISSG